MMRLSGVMSTLLDHTANYPLSSPNPPALFNITCQLLKNPRSKPVRKSHKILRTLFCWGPAQSRLKKDNYHLSRMNFPITQLNQTSLEILNPPPAPFYRLVLYITYTSSRICVSSICCFFYLNKGISSMGLQSHHLTALWRNTKQQIEVPPFGLGTGGRGVRCIIWSIISVDVPWEGEETVEHGPNEFLSWQVMRLCDVH
jgi:hypothetical protein